MQWIWRARQPPNTLSCLNAVNMKAATQYTVLPKCSEYEGSHPIHCLVYMQWIWRARQPPNTLSCLNAVNMKAATQYTVLSTCSEYEEQGSHPIHCLVYMQWIWRARQPSNTLSCLNAVNMKSKAATQYTVLSKFSEYEEQGSHPMHCLV